MAQRESPSHRRVFRDAHPLDNQPELLFDDENEFRIEVGSLGLHAAANRLEEQLDPVRTFDVLAEPLTGAVYQFFNSYSVQPGTQPRVTPGSRSLHGVSASPLPDVPSLRIATFNVENLYDFRNDPSACCDAPNDLGNEWIQPPFDYPPESPEAYKVRLHRLARQIVQGMGAPDLLLVQEIENQDMLTFADDGTSREGADGRLDTLQELALTIRELGGPVYETASNRKGGDLRGIICAFLFLPTRLSLVPEDPAHFLLGSEFSLYYAGNDAPMNRDTANPKCFNAEIPDSLPMDDGCIPPMSSREPYRWDCSRCTPRTARGPCSTRSATISAADPTGGSASGRNRRPSTACWPLEY